MKYIRFGLFLKLFLLISLVLAAVSCGTEGFEPNIVLNSPLGLSATRTNISGTDGIFLQFMGLNNETYFSGYNIYMQTNSDSLASKPGYVPPTPGSIVLPTTNLSAVNYAQTITYFVTKDYSANTTGDAFTPGTDYFFYVTAYSILHGKSSSPCKSAHAVY